ncbi:MAG: GPR endopeptidase [Ruminococcaceae bacterium]|nr:GPR endopeptidase [Oscillospiraceae bacterium]
MRYYFNERREKDRNGYTDLAVERRRADTNIRGVEYTSCECAVGIWERIRIISEEGARSINRPIGRYDTLNLGRMDLLSDEEILDAGEEIAKKLCETVDGTSASPERILVVGLGNRNLTPDSIGPKTAAQVKPTLHIKEFDEDMFDSLECSEIAVLCPGVTAESGMEASEVIRGVCRRLLPDVIIAVDAIATCSKERLGTTVQISDTGLFPGSGVGNYRNALTEESIGIPIIAIGVPTVIDSRIFSLGDSDEKVPYSEESMLVSPKEIDEITNVAAEIIGGAINQAFGISSYC